MCCLPFAASRNGEGNDDEENGLGVLGPNGLPHTHYFILFCTILYYFTSLLLSTLQFNHKKNKKED